MFLNRNVDLTEKKNTKCLKTAKCVCQKEQVPKGYKNITLKM